MKEWVDRNYPGLGIQIGEWSFGGEQDITGALATAEALGRFAQFGATSAYYWTAPGPKSASAQGFLAFRNFDGLGGRFLDLYVPSTSSGDVSFFASRDDSGQHLVMVAVNLSPDAGTTADVDLRTCGAVASRKTYVYTRGAAGFAPITAAPGDGVSQTLAPWSITVMDVVLAPRAGK
jgi:hypothetical protein